MVRINILCCVALISLIGVSCTSNEVEELIDCSQSTLSLVLLNAQDASSCAESDGEILVGAQGGSGEYSFSLTATANSTGIFTGLSAGIYIVSVSDNGSCNATLEVEVKAIGSALTATASVTADSGCTESNGAISLSAKDGVMPYEFGLDGADFSSTSVFSGLADGKRRVVVRDAEGCILTVEVIVPKAPTNIDFASQIKPILDTNCAIPSCHNGDLGESRNWTVNATVLANARNIRSRTQNGSMPPSGSLSPQQISLIGCWVDGL